MADQWHFRTESRDVTRDLVFSAQIVTLRVVTIIQFNSVHCTVPNVVVEDTFEMYGELILVHVIWTSK